MITGTPASSWTMFSIRKVYRFLKQLPTRALYPRPSKSFIRLGTSYGGWWVETSWLDSHSRVISAGVGRDVSFDLELIERFGCYVVALDPTPKAIGYIEERAIRSSRFEFLPLALSGREGIIGLKPPEKPGHVSYTRAASDSASIKYPATTVAKLMDDHGWSELDLLKIDIEGAEFEVVDSIVRDEIKAKQLCIEFHPALAGTVDRDIRSAIAELGRSGYELVFKEFHNYTFFLR